MQTKSNSKTARIKSAIPHRERRHSLRLRLDPDGGFVPAEELEASLFNPLRADWIYRGVDEPRRGYVVFDRRSKRQDSWHANTDAAEARKWALRDAQYELLREMDAKYEAGGWVLRLPAPGPFDELVHGVDRVSRDWDASRPREEWEAELLADLAALRLGPDDDDTDFGDDSRFEIAVDLDARWQSRELFEAEETARILRRSGSTRVDAEDEARMYGGF